MDTYRKQIDDAAEAIYDAYWDACNEKGGAIPPGEITDRTSIQDYLMDAYDIALRREDFVRAGRAIDWEDSNNYF